MIEGLYAVVWALCVMMYTSNKLYAAQRARKYRFIFLVLSECHVSVKELTRNQTWHRHPSTSACDRWSAFLRLLQLHLSIFSQLHAVKRCSLLPGQSRVSPLITSVTVKTLRAFRPAFTHSFWKEGRRSHKRERRLAGVILHSRLMRRTPYTAKHVLTCDIWWLNEASAMHFICPDSNISMMHHTSDMKQHILTAAPQLHSKLKGTRCDFNEPHVPSKCSNLLTLFRGLVFVTFKLIHSLYPVKSKTITINNVVNRPKSRNQNKPGDEDSQGGN